MIYAINKRLWKFTLVSFIIYISSCGKEKVVIDGYQDQITYFPNDTINLFLNSVKGAKTLINLYNINNEIVDQIKVTISPQDISDTAYWWKNGFKYKKTASYLPNDFISGIYYFEGSSPFIIKNNKRNSEILLVYPSNTVNAYNKRGGRSSYTKPLGQVLNFRRPSKLQKYTIPFLKWLNDQPFNIDYISDLELENYNNIHGYKLIIIPGHSEYWTRSARKNFDRFVHEGNDAIILSGNTMWWQVRYHGNKQICYKHQENDSTVPSLFKTINWNDTILNYPVTESIGANFMNGGYGLKKDNGWDGYLIVKDSPLFNGTSIKVGDTISCPSAEFDGVPHLKGHFPYQKTESFSQFELLGYDIGINGKKEETYLPFIVFKKNDSTGTIINTCSTNWCSDGFTGKDGEKIKQLTYNFIDFLLKKKAVFTKSSTINNAD